MQDTTKMPQPIDAVLFDMRGTNSSIPDAREVILTLFRRGYRLGLVSNSVSSVEVPQMLNELEVSGCFEIVLFSCVEGIHKPDPTILLEASAGMGVDPARCAYIGDQASRDVTAARRAGFAQTVLLSKSVGHVYLQVQNSKFLPDIFTDNFLELLELFPPRTPPGEPGDGCFFFNDVGT
jgi:HAD superfamily hydrolase (TIGR01549 family)